MARKYRKGDVRVALFYPSTAQVALSTESFYTLFHLLNGEEGIYAERFVMPTSDGEAPRSIDSGSTLRSFDVILVSVHYELDYVNIVRGLLLSGIPATRWERRDKAVVVGGPPVSANPLPLSDIVDVAVLGEMEAVWGSLVDALRAYGDTRNIDVFESVPGALVMGRTRTRVRIPVAYDLQPQVYCPVRRGGVFGDMLMVEIARGCPFACKFCMDSYLTKPYRMRSYADIAGFIKRHAVRHEAMGLVALSANEHPYFKRILELASELGIRTSVPSLRADRLTEEDVELISRAGQRTLTVAPETSSRIRSALDKHIDDDDLYCVASYVAKRGMRLKLYLMVGFPGERRDDLDEIVNIISKIRKEGTKELYISVNPLVIKPMTPLQWEPMRQLEDLRGRLNYIVSRVGGVETSTYGALDAVVQAAISLGDENVGRVLVEVAMRGGTRGAWRRALREGMLSHVFKGRDELPWGFIQGDVTIDELKKRHEEYVEAVM